MNAKIIEINSSEKLSELFEKSNETPVVLFKHSITCPISANVFDEVSEIDSEINLVVVQRARSISNEIAERTHIRHESPQAIILKNGEAIYHASHYDITGEDILNSL